MDGIIDDIIKQFQNLDLALTLSRVAPSAVSKGWGWGGG